jgi:hypothetical protein
VIPTEAKGSSAKVSCGQTILERAKNDGIEKVVLLTATARDSF